MTSHSPPGPAHDEGPGSHRSLTPNPWNLDGSYDTARVRPTATTNARRPVREVVRIDLAAHVVKGGWVDNGALSVACRVAGTVLPGQCVEVTLGAVRYLDEQILWSLAQYLADAGPVQVAGSDGRAVAEVAEQLERQLAYFGAVA